MKTLAVTNTVAKQVIKLIEDSFANGTAVPVEGTKLFRIPLNFIVTEQSLPMDGENYKLIGFADGKALTVPVFYKPMFYNQLTTVKPYTAEEKAEFIANKTVEQAKTANETVAGIPATNPADIF